ncbi:hypothetical protein N0V90_006082 [Kalmusia sp. IMI 367209]|nr:hypothetical protein N0V90_006082 [Kalmusia sp. IMI 367209]
MHLPPELHDEILRHLGRGDVASYRLVCRKFATTGAPSLFSRLHFRTSLPSLQRLANISKRACGRYVKHLLWNTTGSEFEAKAFLEGLRMRELKYILGETVSCPSLNTAQKEKEGDEGPRVELSQSLGVFVLQAIFAGFPNLKELYVVTNGTQPNAFADDGWAQRAAQQRVPDAWPKPWKATHGCPRCHGLCQAIQSNARYEMQAALLAAHSAGRPLTHLRIDVLSFWSVPREAEVVGFERAFAHVTNLQLVLQMPSRALAQVQAMFRTATQLRSLKLWLHSSSWWDGVDHAYSVLRLQDIVPSPSSFPYLRELEIHQMDVSEPFMVDFLRAHAQMMRVLKMHRMRLDPKGSWPALFQSIGGKMQLDVVWLHGHFEEGISENGWDMDAPHGRRLERHLLGREVDCPIDEENRWCRW